MTKKQREKIIGFGIFFVILQIVQEIVVNIKGNDRIGRLQQLLLFVRTSVSPRPDREARGCLE